MRLAATFDSGEAQVVRGRIANVPVGEVRACVVLGDAARQNGKSAADGDKFELFLNCCGASHLSIKCRLVSEISLEKLPFGGKRVVGGQADDRGLRVNCGDPEAGGVEGPPKVAHVSAAVA
jgi:hypothetical protein